MYVEEIVGAQRGRRQAEGVESRGNRGTIIAQCLYETGFSSANGT
jgi:hypothetical protein